MQRAESAILIYKGISAHNFTVAERLEYQYLIANLSRYTTGDIFDAAIAGVEGEDWDDCLARLINFIVKFKNQVKHDMQYPDARRYFPVPMHQSLIDKLQRIGMEIGLHLYSSVVQAASV